MIEIKDKEDLRVFRIRELSNLPRDIIFQKLSKFNSYFDNSLMYEIEEYLYISIKYLMFVSKKNRDLAVILNDLEITEPLKAHNLIDFFNLYYNEYLLEIDDETLSNFIDQFLIIVNKDNREKLKRGEVFTYVELTLDNLGTRYLSDNYTNGKSFEAVCVAILENVKSQLNKFE